MSKPMVKIVNAETGEEIEREMNAEELAQLKLDQARVKTEEEEIIAKAQAKQAILDKLGLSAEEAATLLG